MIKINAWIIVSRNGQFFGPYASPEEAARVIEQRSDIFAGPLLIQPVLELGSDAVPR